MTRAVPRSRVIVLLFLGGIAISGFTILRQIDPFDEGLTLQAARRVAEGQLPYRDFLWAYGPAHVYLLAGLFKLFGTSLLWWRIVRVITDAAVALVVFAIVRQRASNRVAIVAWLISACAMAQPTGANPFAQALLLSLAAVALAARGRGARDLVLAGVLCALAAAWRLDFGVYALIGAAVTQLAASWRAALRPIATIAGAFLALTVVVYLPFVIADGPAAAWRDLVERSLTTGRYWHLPFPIAYHGRFRLWPPYSLAHDAKDLLGFYVPLLLLIGVAIAVLVIVQRRLQRDPLVVGLAALAITYIAYLLSRTDEFHSTPLIVTLAALLPILALQVPVRAAAIVGLVLLALLAYGASNRLSALFGPPELAAIHVPAADGVEAPPAEARAVQQMVQAVQRRVPPGQPIYTVTTRADLVRINDPLIYVMAERDNPTRQDFGLQTGARAQAQIVASLMRARPKVIVRWTSPESTEREPNARGRPTNIHILDRWLAAHYHAAATYGYYEILVPS